MMTMLKLEVHCSYSIMINDDNAYTTLFQSGNSFNIKSNDDQVYAILFQSGNSFNIKSNKK